MTAEIAEQFEVATDLIEAVLIYANCRATRLTTNNRLTNQRRLRPPRLGRS